MKKKLFILFSFVSLLGIAQPGKEAWHWEFGNVAALDFSGGNPVPVVLYSFGSLEGCASISDPITGQLLFYAGGTVVINKNGNAMNNGYNLKGHSSTTQAALIVPRPGSNSLYYVLSADFAHAANKGIFYSVVDMSKQSGLGAVTIKNKLLVPPPTTEKLVGARHCNGTDYWILTHGAKTDAFYSYKVTSAGIDTIPVVSHSGTVHQILTYYWGEGIGYMKISPDGSKLALGICSDSIPVLEIFDFNNATGIVSNPITITYPGASGPYGLTFSPDSKKLYACPYIGDTLNALYQYDISSGVPATIIASQTLLYSSKFLPNGTNTIGAMQIGPDGKIYIARYYKDSLAVINNPNNLGLSCNFQVNGTALWPTGATYSMYGLPNFIDANYAGIQINIPDVQQCNTFTTTTLDAGSGFVNYFWSTGASTQTVSISSPGKYWVTVTSAQGCTRTDTVDAYLLNPMKSETLACDTFHANVTQGGVLAYHWFDANTNPIRNFTQSGNYYVDINYVSGCAIRDSINVTIVSSPNINLGPDTSFCKGNFFLNAQNPSSTYVWSTNETSSQITVKNPGTYWVKVTDANGCKDSDTLIVKPQFTAFDFVMPNIVTPNDDKINDVVDFGIYQFSSLQIQTYNRWGQKVFESNNADAVWKPTVDDGTYFYTAQYTIDCGIDSQTKNIKGYIQVLR